MRLLIVVIALATSMISGTAAKGDYNQFFQCFRGCKKNDNPCGKFCLRSIVVNALLAYPTFCVYRLTFSPTCS
ncbi:hypothetical protein PTTW11_03127 [Pyrenophora teres f. teres]|uniref:Uncharacterized protein n=1 Tax=Pyrenophora teres f. teres TaxID=97479 RepID=A0A6S6VJ07_9PLEO|nr:hypothetical protein PTTW11_03127 [Pyrenophora teres f. teres]